MVAYMHICLHIFTHASIYAYMLTYMHVCKHAGIYANTYAYMQAYTLQGQTGTDTHTHTDTHTDTRTHSQLTQLTQPTHRLRSTYFFAVVFCAQALGYGLHIVMVLSSRHPGRWLGSPCCPL